MSIEYTLGSSWCAALASEAMSSLTESEALSSRAQLEKCDDPLRITDILNMLAIKSVSYNTLKVSIVSCFVACFSCMDLCNVCIEGYKNRRDSGQVS